MTTQQRYGIQLKSGQKCWITYEKEERVEGEWKFIFPEIMSLYEIAEQIEKQFQTNPEIKVIKFKYDYKFITIDSSKVTISSIFDTCKQQI